MKIRKNTHINIIVVSLSIFVKAIVVISSLYLYVVLLTMLEKEKRRSTKSKLKRPKTYALFGFVWGQEAQKQSRKQKIIPVWSFFQFINHMYLALSKMLRKTKKQCLISTVLWLTTRFKNKKCYYFLRPFVLYQEKRGWSIK